jgi:hypothetical protein
MSHIGMLVDKALVDASGKLGKMLAWTDGVIGDRLGLFFSVDDIGFLSGSCQFLN